MLAARVGGVVGLPSDAEEDAMDEQFETLLASVPPGVQALARGLRKQGCCRAAAALPLVVAPGQVQRARR
jgi:hypothetical protein